ncbi:Hypothetical protein SMAX5B_005052 [Scophthalmus maximus]|uniref:Uncharacterized protein n=1 Tax=Scophthalmus maximus TaxID=52904 RepID=A0A2U9AZE8_SCOMX|nr:Hypothetical protein SMAX5B_005052 [Scophthalmus maximus]
MFKDFMDSGEGAASSDSINGEEKYDLWLLRKLVEWSLTERTWTTRGDEWGNWAKRLGRGLGGGQGVAGEGVGYGKSSSAARSPARNRLLEAYVPM